MKTVAISVIVAALLAAGSALKAQDAPQFPEPQEEHEWLQQLVGEWETQGEAIMGPDAPPMKCQGTESIRAIGGFWTLSESKNTIMEMPMTGIMTLGYDPEKKKYVGTWIDSMTNYMWKYEGSVDAGGKILTLETEGPNLVAPGTTARYKEVIEFKNKDHKVFTSSVEGPDGKWFTFMTINAKRKK